MTILLCTVSDNPAEIAHVKKLISDAEWGKVFAVGFISKDLIKTEFYKDSEHFTYILCSKNMTIPEISNHILEQIKEDMIFGDIGLNIVSGSGKLHMATLSAALKSGCGIRLITITKEGIKEI